MTSVHPPYDVRIFHKECLSIVQAGYQVSLIVPSLSDQITDQINICSIPKPHSRLWRMTITSIQIFFKAIRLNGYIYHFHDPELIFVGVLLKLLGKRVIYDVHEDLPNRVLSKPYIPTSLRALTSKIVKLVEHVAGIIVDRVVATTPTIANSFPSEKTTLVRNFPVIQELLLNEITPYLERKNLIIYIGIIDLSRGIKEMVEAMDILSDWMDAKLIIAGEIRPQSLYDKLKEMPGWKSVRYIGWKSRQEIDFLLGEAKVGLVTMHPTPSHLTGYPTKLFEYMSAGIPVLASDFPVWRNFLENPSCGLLVNPLDPKAIAEGLFYLLNHPSTAKEMGDNGRQAVKERYNWSTESKKLLKIYRSFAQSK
jgi:glycosyltransferase involved in cell wall biosynthesis